MLYKIVRFYQSTNKQNRTIKKGLTLKQALKHCNNPGTRGLNWFDGFVKKA